MSVNSITLWIWRELWGIYLQLFKAWLCTHFRTPCTQWKCNVISAQSRFNVLHLVPDDSSSIEKTLLLYFAFSYVFITVFPVNVSGSNHLCHFTNQFASYNITSQQPLVLYGHCFFSALARGKSSTLDHCLSQKYWYFISTAIATCIVIVVIVRLLSFLHTFTAYYLLLFFCIAILIAQ